MYRYVDLFYENIFLRANHLVDKKRDAICYEKSILRKTSAIVCLIKNFLR